MGIAILIYHYIGAFITLGQNIALLLQGGFQSLRRVRIVKYLCFIVLRRSAGVMPVASAWAFSAKVILSFAFPFGV